MNVLFSLAAGVLLGGFFYGGLWLTVRMLLATRHSVLLTICSFWGRTLVTLAGFFFAMNGKWQNAFACLAGFGFGRVVVSALLPKTGGAPRCT